MGEGFNDWYLETFIESAKEPDPSESPPIQGLLPGFIIGCQSWTHPGQSVNLVGIVAARTECSPHTATSGQLNAKSIHRHPVTG